MMFLVVVVPVILLAVCVALPREPILNHWRIARLRTRRAVRHRTMRFKLPEDWWEQFERDLSAYLDPQSVRARKHERS